MTPMLPHSALRACCLLLFGLLCACGDKETDDTASGDGGGSALTWYSHPCGNGDPVSRTCEEGVATVEITDPDWPTCASLGMSEGDPCTTSGDKCVLQAADACEDDPTQVMNSASYLWCQTAPFEDQECPQSTSSAKEAVRYLEQPDREAIAGEVLGLRFARYRYLPEASADRSEQLGMIIEDAPDVVFVEGQRINLYAYASALAVTVQEQDARIRALEARLGALEAGEKTE